MSSEPLKPMGIQTPESVQVEEAERAKKAKALLDESATRAERAIPEAKDSGRAIRAQAKVAADMATAYARERPVQALLVSCAVGALLMGLLVLASKREGL